MLRSSKTGLNPHPATTLFFIFFFFFFFFFFCISFYWSFQGGSSLAVLLCSCGDGFLCGICFDIVCSLSLLLSVWREALWKHAYSNIQKISPWKTENFKIKTRIFFHNSAQNIDCEYSLEPPQRGGSNEYPQSMFLSRNKKNSVYPCKPQFYYIKVGFKGVKII